MDNNQTETINVQLLAQEMKFMNKSIDEFKIQLNKINESLASKSEVVELRSQMSALEHTLKHDYVTKDEVRPLKQIVYGAVGFILVTVLGALLFLIINSPHK